jgi:ankyrin repeat protein
LLQKWVDLQTVKNIFFNFNFQVDLLIANGVNVNAKDYLGNTPLHYIAVCGLEVAAASLVRKGAVVTATNTAKKTPLHFAVENDSEGVATILTSNGGINN